MRRNLLLTFVVCVCFVRANAQVLGEPVVTWDFAGGIPSNWEYGVNSGTGLAAWEYRGPATTPDYNTGARGSCAAIGLPLASVTQTNGFMIFDSNYWDDPGSECGAGFGTGPAPAPHTAWLITNPIDLSTENGAVLTFQQQYRHYSTTTTKVQISTNGGTDWTDIINNTGSQSATTVWTSANISAYIAGATDVRFKFIFQGTYYWWLLDDITVFIPNNNDIKISAPHYATNAGFAPDVFRDLQYDQYPVNMIPPFHFSAKGTNIGANPQTNVHLNTRVVKNGSIEMLNTNSAATTLAPSATETYVIDAAYTNPAQVGEYSIYYTLLQDEADENPADNIDSLDFTISEYTYARDEGPMEDTYQSNAVYASHKLEAANYFQARAANKVCRSLQLAVAEGTDIGAQIRGVIYKEDFVTVVAQTAIYSVNYANLNGVGDEKMITLPLITPLTLSNDSVYVVAMQQVNVSETIVVARSGTALEETSVLWYPDVNALFYSTKAPMVRMNIFLPGAVPGCTDALASNYNASALTNDGSCIYPGCAHEDADNYDPAVNFDDNSCVTGGCLDPEADNYNPAANYDNGICQYLGCTDPMASNYEPTANVADGSCVYIDALIEVSVISGCAPLTVSITNETAIEDGSQCEFTLNDEVIESTCIPEFEYTLTEPGTYELKFTHTVGTTSGDTTLTIIVYGFPEIPTISYNPDDHTLSCANCADDTQWILDGDEVAGANAANLAIFSDGTYQNGNYQVSSDNNGCASVSGELLVLQPYFSVSSMESCAPAILTVTDLTDDIAGSECTLNLGDGTIITGFTTSTTHVFVDADTYNITLTCTSGGTTGTFEIPVIVNEIIVPELNHDGVSGEVECLNCAEFTDVTWVIDGTSFTGNGPFPDNGTVYAVTGVTENDCSGFSQLIIESVAESISDAFSLFPNPADESISIRNNDHLPYSIAVYDMYGKVVVAYSNLTSSLFTIDSAALSAGLYTLVMQSSGASTSKLVEISH